MMIARSLMKKSDKAGRGYIKMEASAIKHLMLNTTCFPFINFIRST